MNTNNITTASKATTSRFIEVMKKLLLAKLANRSNIETFVESDECTQLLIDQHRYLKSLIDSELSSVGTTPTPASQLPDLLTDAERKRRLEVVMKKLKEVGKTGNTGVIQTDNMTVRQYNYLNALLADEGRMVNSGSRLCGPDGTMVQAYELITAIKFINKKEVPDEILEALFEHELYTKRGSLDSIDRFANIF